MRKNRLRSSNTRARTFICICVFVLLAACTTTAYLRRPDKPISDKPAVTAPSRPVVCVDPGHPSECNTGKIVQNGTRETHINWVVGLKLEKVLKEEYGIDVIRTKKDEDRYIRNSGRARIANKAKVDLAVHLHCDTGPGSGFTLYFPNKVGHSEGKTGPSQEVIRESRKAAEILEIEMERELKRKLKNRGRRGDETTYWGSKTGVLTTSAHSKIPTLTVEMVFLSNPRDARFIKSEEGQTQMAEAMAKGIAEYLKAAQHL